MDTIFISYRDADSGFGAAFLDNALSREFGPEHVFRDSRSVRPGDVFDPEIIRAVRESLAMLVLIGPGWFGDTDQQGERKIDDPNDFVRRELVEAFRHDVRVIPVLLGVEPLTPESLPDDVRPLAERQYRIVRKRESEQDVAALITTLAEMFPGLTASSRDTAGSPSPLITAHSIGKIGAVFNERVDITYGDLNIS